MNIGDVEIVGDYTYVRRLWHGVYRVAGPDADGRIVSQVNIHPVEALEALGWRDSKTGRRKMEEEIRSMMQKWAADGWKIETHWPEELP